jgi:hypothetical protein
MSISGSGGEGDDEMMWNPSDATDAKRPHVRRKRPLWEVEREERLKRDLETRTSASKEAPDGDVTACIKSGSQLMLDVTSNETQQVTESSLVTLNTASVVNPERQRNFTGTDIETKKPPISPLLTNAVGKAKLNQRTVTRIVTRKMDVETQKNALVEVEVSKTQHSNSQPLRHANTHTSRKRRRP